VLLGLLLLGTAGLKLFGGSNQIARTVLPLLSPRLYAAGVAFEAILGAWLLTGIAPVWSWITSIGFFGLLSYMSLRLGLMGQTSCGCLGAKVQLNPWWAFAVDVIAIIALLVWRPRQIRAGIRAGIPSLVGGTLIVSVVALGLVLWHGSLRSALAHIRGETIVVNPGVVELGNGKAGEVRMVSLELTNYHEKPVRIVGGTSDCSCIATQDLPMDIPVNESRTIRVQVKFTGTPGVIRRRFSLFADIERLRVMPVAVTGRVVQ
jgi:hypothetical protein